MWSGPAGVVVIWYDWFYTRSNRLSIKVAYPMGWGENRLGASYMLCVQSPPQSEGEKSCSCARFA